MSRVKGALLAVLLTSSLAAAADVPTQAKQLFDEARQRFDAGDLDEAIRLFQASYQLSKAPALLFNLAQAQRLKHDCAGALDSYQRFLELTPGAPNAQVVRERIAEMQACTERARKPLPEPTAEGSLALRLQEKPPPPPRTPSPTLIGTGVAVGGAGLAAVTVGLVLTVKGNAGAAHLTDFLSTGGVWTSALTSAQRDSTLRTPGAVLITSGAIGLAAGAVLALVGVIGTVPEGVALVPMREGGLLVWTGRWP